MAIEKELLDQLLSGRDPNEVFAKDGLLDDLKKALSERILNAELDEHLDGERVEGGVNRRDGHSKKSVLTGTSRMTLSIPRDQAGMFDPKPIAKHQRRFPDFDDKIISRYALPPWELRSVVPRSPQIEDAPDRVARLHRCRRARAQRGTPQTWSMPQRQLWSATLYVRHKAYGLRPRAP
jgi:putative transposase